MNLRSICDHTTSRILIITAGVILILVLTIIIFSDSLLNSLVKDKLIEEANSSPNINLQIEDMSYHFFSNSIDAVDIRFAYRDSSTEGTSSYKVNIPLVEIRGINWFDVILGSGLSLNTLAIVRPILQITTEKDSFNKEQENSRQKGSRSVPLFNKSFIGSLPSRIKPLKLDRLLIHSGKLYHASSTREETMKDTIRNYDLSIAGIRLDSTLSDSSLNYIIAQDFSFSAEKVRRMFVKGGNEIMIDSISFSGGDSLLSIKNFAYKPFLSRDEYFARKKYRTDMRIFKFGSLRMEGVDYKDIVQHKICEIANGVVDNFYIDILTDKRLPLDPSCCPKMPNEILRDLEFGIDIKKFVLRNGELYVKSLQDNSDTAAVIPFTMVHAEFANINNLKTKDNEVKIKAEGNMFDAGRMTLNMWMDLSSDKLNFKNHGKLDSMNVKAMNQWLTIENLVRLTRGQVSEIRYSTETKNGLALAKVTPIYRDLKVGMLTKAKQKKTITTFLANAIKMREGNPEDDELKTGSLYYKRKSEDAFLDILWVPLREALGKVAGY